MFISKTDHDGLIRRNFNCLTPVLSVLVPSSPFTLQSEKSLDTYSVQYNFQSSRVLRNRLELFSASLQDWEDLYGERHELDDRFWMTENVTQAARSRLLDVAYNPINVDVMTMGDKHRAASFMAVATGATNLKHTGLAARELFFPS